MSRKEYKPNPFKIVVVCSYCGRVIFELDQLHTLEHILIVLRNRYNNTCPNCGARLKGQILDIEYVPLRELEELDTSNVYR